jgi:hypothetical protein
MFEPKVCHKVFNNSSFPCAKCSGYANNFQGVCFSQIEAHLSEKANRIKEKYMQPWQLPTTS